MWQWQHPFEVTGASMEQRDNIRYTSFTLNYVHSLLLLSDWCDRVRLSLFHNPYSFTTEHIHHGRCRAIWFVKQSQWGWTGCHQYHANGTGSMLRRQKIQSPQTFKSHNGCGGLRLSRAIAVVVILFSIRISIITWYIWFNMLQREIYKWHFKIINGNMVQLQHMMLIQTRQHI